MIKGKHGRFRANLLGKRVDYSARSVIIVGPELRLNQCGLPKKIALELYQPFIIRRLKDRGLADTIKSAKKMLERKDREIWDILEEVICQHPVLLNRQPTLHRHGIQAFEPVLMNDHAIHLHPLVCRSFGADFDGDQMSVHLPLSIQAVSEAYVLLSPSANLLSAADGHLVYPLSQEMVLGLYYLTSEAPAERTRRPWRFASPTEAILAYEHRCVAMREPIDVRLPESWLGRPESGSNVSRILHTTVGRLLFNEALGQSMPFINKSMSAESLSEMLEQRIRVPGTGAADTLLETLMRLGVQEATRSGMSLAIGDFAGVADFKASQVRQARASACFTADDTVAVRRTWAKATSAVDAEVQAEFIRLATKTNLIGLLINSGARQVRPQLGKLAGIHGQVRDMSGRADTEPILSNLREGHRPLDYFRSCHRTRRGKTDIQAEVLKGGLPDPQADRLRP